MNKKLSYMFLGLTLSLLYLSLFTYSTSATEVWRAEFGDFTGWTQFAFEDWYTGPTITGNFSTDGGVLISLDDDANYARHDSTVNVGTWSFDLYVPDVPYGYVGVAFMSNGTRPLELDTRMLSVQATTDGIDRFILWWERGPFDIVTDVCYTPEGSILGWHHIDITRTNTGNINIFFNGTHQYWTLTNDVTSSTYFECFAVNATGAAFDNIIVSDSIDVTTSPTTTTTTTSASLPWDLILIGSGVAIVVIIVVIVIFKRR